MSPDPWAAFALSTDGLSARYCELNRLGEWLRQPSNTISSFSYLVAGVLVLRSMKGRADTSLRLVLGLSFFALGLGSQFFHASITLVAQELDMAGTYAAVLALIAIALRQRFERLPVELVLVALLVIDALFYAFEFYRHGPWLLPSLLGVTLVCAVAVAVHSGASRSLRSFGFAVAGLAVGAASWLFDDQKFLCDPRSALQWHALWHLATAFGAYQLFSYLHRGDTHAHGALRRRVPASA